MENKIYQLRKSCGMTQEQLAEEVGVARQTISKWELGETAPDIKQAQVLAQIFGITLNELVEDSTKSPVRVAKNNIANPFPWKKLLHGHLQQLSCVWQFLVFWKLLAELAF